MTSTVPHEEGDEIAGISGHDHATVDPVHRDDRVTEIGRRKMLLSWRAQIWGGENAICERRDQVSKHAPFRISIETMMKNEYLTLWNMAEIADWWMKDSDLVVDKLSPCQIPESRTTDLAQGWTAQNAVFWSILAVCEAKGAHVLQLLEMTKKIDLHHGGEPKSNLFPYPTYLKV